MRSLFIIAIILSAAVSTLAVIGDKSGGFATPYSCPTGLASDGENLYLADSKSDMIYKLNCQTGEIISEYAAPGFRPAGLTWDGNCLWLIDIEEEAILQIDPKNKSQYQINTGPGRAANRSGLGWQASLAGGFTRRFDFTSIHRGRHHDQEIQIAV